MEKKIFKVLKMVIIYVFNVIIHILIKLHMQIRLHLHFN